ncbi:hypothetical protein E4T42_08511 [Aureobasidium subglaciale]|nr:hypothetical protein E4T38_09218 [Aureobasidium subglaciale]KAI5214201.1 hypothetical protein E4T40_09132 [Aureobasidium subglaciale]KAI5216734.1 hypothetical protein E4T41_09133 [Aureobasidium subglaciale]KAI5239996.1 hypothetical protein E4T42_08511 [Aureobasidium subglaciale]KAI5254487.1 hypothetical protein E4T46_09125 [Aureobasidium subglaciale]
MSSPNSKTDAASVESKCTTFSDIMTALDETYDRIASIGPEDIIRERHDSMDSAAARQAGGNIVAFDTKTYLANLKAGLITLSQIQVATGSTKLPEEHVADWLRINGPLPPPWCGSGKCSYPPYPLPHKRKRDAVADNIDDAIKKVKGVFGK